MALFRSITGVVRMELTSADLSGMLNQFSNQNIALFDLMYIDELTANFTVFRKDRRKLEEICTARGDILKNAGCSGLFWKIAPLKRRPVLVTGVLLLAILMGFVPSRVLFIEVEGNGRIPGQQILEAAADCGIRFGASRRLVRSEQVKNSLLGAIPELQWAGINTYGSRAVITVRERTDAVQGTGDPLVSSIVAAVDGVVTECTVTRGSGLCQPGQAVAKGQILISGYTDCGITIRATRAEGEITARTRRDVTAVTLSQWLVRREEMDSQSYYSLILGKKRINFYKGSGIFGGSCVKMYSKYVLTLPGGFELPLSLIRETVIPAKTDEQEIREPEDTLRNFAGKYLSEQMIAGRVLSEEVSVYRDGGIFRLVGTYACLESIGQRQEEKIGEYNG